MPWRILPTGQIDVATGHNEYWPDGTNEVWSDRGKLFVVHTSMRRPHNGIGTVASFAHDQTGRLLHLNATMLGWFSTDPKGEMGGEVPLKGKLPIATYK